MEASAGLPKSLKIKKDGDPVLVFTIKNWKWISSLFLFFNCRGCFSYYCSSAVKTFSVEEIDQTIQDMHNSHTNSIFKFSISSDKSFF